MPSNSPRTRMISTAEPTPLSLPPEEQVELMGTGPGLDDEGRRADGHRAEQVPRFEALRGGLPSAIRRHRDLTPRGQAGGHPDRYRALPSKSGFRRRRGQETARRRFASDRQDEGLPCSRSREGSVP